MARSHGKILAAAWNDDDWTSLPPRLQWMYWTLLGQPKLTLIGCMDYMPTRWAKGAGGIEAPYVEECVAELEGRRFVLVDDDTDEILIRTFVRHDGIEQANVNIRKGMWGAWSAISSPVLRQVAVDNMPESLWDLGTDFTVPAAATQMRLERPFDWPSEQASERPSEQAIELTCIPSPASCIPPPSSDATVVLGPYPQQKIPARNVHEAQRALEALKAARGTPPYLVEGSHA